MKLDVVPADLVESVEVNKTLSANQDADAIGGSVNLVTKTATDLPTVSLLGMGGYTPITGGRKLNQFDGTLGQRFGAQKKFGALFGFSYDYNARGIDDVEPGQAVNSLPAGSTFLGPNTEDLRLYHYDRTRYGFDGELDYKLAEMSSVYLRGLFSHFNDYGEDWIYSPGIINFVDSSNVSDPTANTCGITNSNGVQGCGGMGMTNVYRKPEQQVVSVQAGAHHLFGTTVLTYEVALSQANFTGGYPRASFDGPGASDSSVAFGVDTTNPFIPRFPVLNGVNVYDPTQYPLTGLQLADEHTFERDVVGDIALNKQYRLGSRASSFEIGFKGWDARKSQLFNDQRFDASSGSMGQFLSSFHDSNYYFNQYSYGPVTSFTKILSFFNSNPSAFTGHFTTTDGQTTSQDLVANISNDWNIGERIWAGYAMNTISFGKLRIQAGVRIESTEDALRGSNISLDSSGNFASATPLNSNNSYINAFPSVRPSTDLVRTRCCARHTEWALRGQILAMRPHRSCTIPPTRTFRSPREPGSKTHARTEFRPVSGTLFERRRDHSGRSVLQISHRPYLLRESDDSRRTVVRRPYGKHSCERTERSHRRLRGQLATAAFLHAAPAEWHGCKGELRVHNLTGHVPGRVRTYRSPHIAAHRSE